jgi:Na+-driven multidrug efflux pump
VGIGLQGKAIWGNLLNYVVGLPISLGLGFGLALNLAGMWIGIEAASMLICVYFWWLLKTEKWERVKTG